jgi:hypothetical protein
MVKLADGMVISEDQYRVINPCTYPIPLAFKTVDDYNNYVLWSMEESFKDDMFFHILPESFKVYSNSVQNPSITYFNIVDPNKGTIYEHTLNSKIELFALDMNANIETLMKILLEKNLTSLVDDIKQGNYGPIVEYLCHAGYDGCLTPSTKNSPYMVHICQPEKFLSVGRQTELTKMYNV